MAVIVLLVMLAIGCVVMLLVEYAIVRPINMLSDASVRYYNKDNKQRDGHVRFADLGIHTGDEIETLTNSMALMEKDIEDYILSLTETRDQLNTTREYAEEMDRIAYYDALTGVRNKRAYEYSLEELRDLVDKGLQDFGFAVVDLNDLKYYNDTFGHEKGDEAIRMACRIICDTFVRSPVFRYGGDEFTIILKGHDLEHVDELIADMKDWMERLSNDESLPEWTRVKAAVGYAVYDPARDSDPDAVFKRADEAMYEDKKIMKQGKSLSRR
jgi:diguanylate cyclase (GGDEF)-like protein